VSSVVLNAFTVDVEDWFHICGVPALADSARWPTLPARVVQTTDAVLALLDRCGIRATCFVLGWVAERHPELVDRIRRAGHEIGSHGSRHQRVYELDPARFAEDLQASRAALAAAGVSGVQMFRAPEWSINDRAPWALDVLVRAGFTVDSSRAPLRIVGNPAYPQRPHHLQTPAGSIVEVPPLVSRRLGQQMPFGGGWGLRMSRPSRVLHEIARRNRAGEPVTLWLHPWELDPDPPRIRLPPGKHFAHYFRLDGLAERLEDVLRGASFGTIGQMLASCSEVATPVPATVRS
jgi:polysaccharide deacetylase family protein (PEP-CTERM system associated)